MDDNNIVEFPKKNIRKATTEQLAHWWVNGIGPEDDDAVFEQVHAELNRRGEGKICAV